MMRRHISDARGMMKSAEEMRESSRSKLAINAEVREILRLIEDRVARANKEGQNHIEVPIPKRYVTFPNDDDATLMINATVVRELLAANYDVTIYDIKHSLLLDIRWVAELSLTERARMKKLLDEHMHRPQNDENDDDDAGNNSQSDDDGAEA